MTRASHRLFAALDPPALLAAELSSWARAHRGLGLRAVPPENVHLTLAFLGERHASEVEPALRALRAGVDEWTLTGGRAPIELALGGPVWLPTRRPRVLAVEVADPSGELHALQARVSAALRDELGHEDEHRTYRPHLTAARLPSRPDDGRPRTLEPSPAATFAADRITLYRSFLDPAGVTYEPLGDVGLG